jgi:DMSO/TMAO reductase YedYZ heme-binding membrane subunit
MDIFGKIVAIVAAALVLFFLFRYIKSNPESLSLDNLNKSAFTMGILAVGLIAFIAVIVMLLRR